MAADSDPVGNGFVTSLARPGGNITGLSILSPELSGKQLELLKEIVPKLSRVAVLGTSTNPGNPQAVRETELAARALGVQHLYLDIRSPKDIEAVFRGESRAVLTQSWCCRALSPLLIEKKLQSLATKNRLPAIYNREEFVEDGGLMSYGTSLR